MLFELGCHVLDIIISLLGKPDKVTSFIQHVSKIDDSLADNMLAVLSYPRALATMKSSCVEVEGSKRRQLTVCGTEGTLHIQPLDSATAKLTLSKARGEYKEGTQEVKLPKTVRYVAEAADFARIIRNEKTSEYSYDHDLAVQETLLRACQLPLDK
jgi:predicted dehydrogenase